MVKKQALKLLFLVMSFSVIIFDFISDKDNPLP